MELVVSDMWRSVFKKRCVFKKVFTSD